MAVDLLTPEQREALAMRVRALRVQAGLRQYDVAERVGVVDQYISQIERGVKTGISDGTLIRLAVVLGCQPDELLALAGRKPLGVKIVREKVRG